MGVGENEGVIMLNICHQLQGKQFQIKTLLEKNITNLSNTPIENNIFDK